MLSIARTTTAICALGPSRGLSRVGVAIVYRVLRAIFHWLPISRQGKLQLKEHVYTHYGRWFATTLGYQLWARSQESCGFPLQRPRIQAPPRGVWQELAARTDERDRSMCPRGDPVVVIPVFAGREQTLACLYGVLSANSRTSVVVVDDASPDPELVSDLDEIATSGLIELIRHRENQGFVEAANAGLSRHPERDVVLLNSDTLVFGDWLARLSRIAHALPEIGTVTPLSNNGEICSYPEWLVDNPAPCEIDDVTLDALADEANRGRFVDAPTAVGFCMYIKRACLESTGRFDPVFGRGYGEENDFCMRSAARGWRHVIAGGVFVSHRGAVSFGEEAPLQRARGEALVHKRHPSYARLLDRYRRDDPVAPMREALDVARFRHAAPHAEPLRTVLLVTHSWGGGVARHVHDLRRRLEGEGVNVFVLQPRSAAEPSVFVGHPGVRSTPSTLSFPIDGPRDRLIRALRGLGVDHLHIHHLADFGLEAPGWVTSIASELDCPYDLTVHDYMPICPRVNLIGGDGFYCGEPELERCEDCIRTNGSVFGRPQVGAWRDASAGLVNGARRVFCPSTDVIDRIGRYFPDASLRLRPHPGSEGEGHIAEFPDTAGEPRRIAVIGSIGAAKGVEVLLGCARDASRRDLPLEFCVVGDTDRDSQLARTGKVTLSGGYADAELGERLRALRCPISWLPSVWPETWSYTLSEAWREGLYPVAFDIGAPADRIRRVGWGELLPAGLWRDPAAVNDRLLKLSVSPLPRGIAADALAGQYPNLVEDYYEGFACG